MRFLIDDQLPVALAEFLRSSGFAAQHLAEVGLTGVADRQIWQAAEATQSVIVSKDQDFAIMQSFETAGPAIVWIRWGNTRKADLIQSFAKVLPSVIAALGRGERLVELV